MYLFLFVILLLSACTPPAPVIKEVRFPTQSRDAIGPYAVHAKVEGSVSDVQLIVQSVLTAQDQQDQQDQQTRIIPMQIQGDRWFASFDGIHAVVEYRLQIKAQGPGGITTYPSDQPQSFVVTLGTLDCLVDQDCLSYEICHREALICVPKNANCNETVDCPIDQICSQISKKCVYQDDLCSSDEDCVDGYFCQDRVCSSRCQPACELGRKCIFVPADLNNEQIEDDLDASFCIDENAFFCLNDLNCDFGKVCQRSTGQCEQLPCDSQELCVDQFSEDFSCIEGFCQTIQPQSVISQIFDLYCAHCTENIDCGSDLLTCSTRGYCALKCQNDLDCQVGESVFMNQFYCDLSTNSCVEAYPISNDICETGFSCNAIEDCQSDAICLRGKCLQTNVCSSYEDCNMGEICQSNRCMPDLYCNILSDISCAFSQECISNECFYDQNEKASCQKVCNTYQDCLDTEICTLDLSIDGQKHCFSRCDPNVSFCLNDQYCDTLPSTTQFVCIPFDAQCGTSITPTCQNDFYEPNDFDPYVIDLNQSGGFASINGVLCLSNFADQDLYAINSEYPVKLEVFSDQSLTIQVSTSDFQVQEGRVTPNVPFFYEGKIDSLALFPSDIISSAFISYNINLSQQIPVVECIDDSLEYNSDFNNASTFGNGAVLNLTACLNDDDYLRLSRRARGDGLVDFSNLTANTSLYIELYDNGTFFQSFELVDQLSVPISNYRGADWVFRVVNTDQFQGVNYLVTARFN